MGYLDSFKLIDIVAEQTKDDCRTTLTTVLLNRKAMTCEIVHTVGGYIIRVYDAWVFDDEGIYIASDWKYADVEEKSDKIEAMWIKQPENFLMETHIGEDYPMIRSPIKMLLNEQDEACLHYFGKKEVAVFNVTITGAYKLLTESEEDEPLIAVAFLNAVMEKCEVGVKIINEI